MYKNITQLNFGIEKCKSRARETIFWPGLNAEITELIQPCSACQEHRNYQQKETLLQYQPSTQPWERVATDLFKFEKNDYVIVVDYYSNYPEIAKLENTSSQQVIEKLKSIFARHGTPLTVVSDNGPQYSSRDFKEFAMKWEFNHVTSSPRYPKSNGMAERAVQTIKQLLKKAAMNGEDPYLAIQAHRACPDPNGFASPAQRMFKRKIRTRLPLFQEHKERPYNNNHPSKKEFVAQRQKEYHDRNAKDHAPLQQGSTVRLFKDGSWPTKGRVVAQHQHPRSYNIQTEEGRMLRRNRRDLLCTGESFVPKTTDDDLPSESPIITTTPNGLSDQLEGLEEKTNSEKETPVKTRYGRVVKNPNW